MSDTCSGLERRVAAVSHLESPEGRLDDDRRVLLLALLDVDSDDVASVQRLQLGGRGIHRGAFHDVRLYLPDIESRS